MNDNPLTRLLHFTLSANDYGQMVDGLIARQEAWAKTAAWHRGELTDPYFPVEDSKDDYEANAIAEHYSEIIRTLREQAQGQRG